MKRTFLAAVVLLALSISAVVAQEEERIEIEFYHAMGWVNWLTDVFEPAFEEAFPQYDLVQNIPGGYTDVIELNALAQEQGNPPALVQVYEAGTQEMRDSGYFKPIFEAVEGLDEVNGLAINLDDIFEPVGSYYQVDGQYYSMPFNTSTPIIYANMDLLVEAGIAADTADRDSIPETWAEVDAACEAIAANTEADCITWGFGDSWIYEQTMGQMGQLLANNDNGRSGRATEWLVNSELSVDYVTWWQNLAQNGHFVQYASGDDSNAAWANSELAFQIGSSAGAASRIATAGDNFTVLAGRMPYNQDVPYVGNLIGGATIYLTDGLDPEVEQGALTVLAYLLTAENAAGWHQSTGYVPINRAGYGFLEEEGWFEENPVFTVANEQFDAVTVTPASTGVLAGTFIQTRRLLSEGFSKILDGADPQATMDRVKAEADLLLEEYNLLVVGE
jgi:sn-glycerol 3-phosphate transport system substrate-binding protein